MTSSLLVVVRAELQYVDVEDSLFMVWSLYRLELKLLGQGHRVKGGGLD